MVMIFLILKIFLSTKLFTFNNDKNVIKSYMVFMSVRCM